MPRLTISQVDDIIFIYKYRQTLPIEMLPFFDWWLDYSLIHGLQKPCFHRGYDPWKEDTGENLYII